MWVALAFGYHIASRLAYVFGVGTALTQQQRYQLFTRRDGVEAGFHRFRRIASALISNDLASFFLLCMVTRETIPPVVPVMVLTAGGLLLIAIGVWIRLWATMRLGSAAYYWHDFFAASDPVAPERRGPYRFLKNPMYTLGYFHAYGIALVCGSWPGVVAAAFDQVAILVFCRIVEKPHFDLLTNGRSTAPTIQSRAPVQQQPPTPAPA
jgi:protein-S-isoprenylcysteine O-methyltransferase Ste14